MVEPNDLARKPGVPQDRPAYRLGYEAAKDLIAHELEAVKSYQARSIVLLSASALVLGIGIRGPNEAGLGAGTGCYGVVGWVLLVLGLVASVVGALVLNRPLKGAFDPLPRIFVEVYGDNPTKYPDEATLYRALAVAGANASDLVSSQCRRRCRWLWCSLAGLPLVVTGLVVLWVNAV